MFKKLIQSKLEGYVRQYFIKHPEVKLVVVTGSVGKTSTKISIATVLSEKFKIRLHEGNHNSELSSPLAILGIEYPDNIKNPAQWIDVFRAAKERVNGPTDVDVIVQELGTDGIGQVPHFGKYLSPDIAVVTAVSPEHMEFFKTMENVAKEELASADFSKRALINRDDIDGEYAKYLTNANVNTYGTSGTAEFRFIDNDFEIGIGHAGLFINPAWEDPIKTTINVLGEHNIRPAVAAGAVGALLGMNSEQVAVGLSKIRAVSGRMNVLKGQKNTIIIDDTYNSSPLAADSALTTLYSLTVPQAIAVLGSMNELGTTSQAEHTALGKLCDPTQLTWVITVGEDAENYLAPAARERGCQVRSFKTALQAGAFVHEIMEDGAAILFKGSQGGVYLEEAIKIILHSTDDESKLVRQSLTWMKTKNAYFAKFEQ
jgi:UDP-N-acetylmuramoyl-tripeptide--D-alanyl-D-alanine ligase